MSCRKLTSIDKCSDVVQDDKCSEYTDGTNRCMDGNGGKCKEGDECRSRKNRDNTGSKDDLESSEIFRIIITYCVTFFVSMALLMGNYDSSYNKTLGVILMVSITYFLSCGLFDYFWMKYYLIDNRQNGDTDNRELSHNIIYMILPAIVLIFGYTLLIAGFKSNLSMSNTKSLSLFLVKIVALMVIIISYLYYIIKLMNILNDSNTRNKDENTQVDILYSILHPVSILLISSIFYAIIVIFLGRSSVSSVPSVSPPPAIAPSPPHT